MDKLRIGILVDAAAESVPEAISVSGWQAALLEGLRAREDAQIVLAMALAPPKEGDSRRSLRSGHAWRAVTALEDRLARRRFAQPYLERHWDPDARSSLKPLLGSAPLLRGCLQARRPKTAAQQEAQAQTGLRYEGLDAASLSALRAWKPDLLLWLPGPSLVARHLCGGVLRAARHGVLAFQHADSRVQRGLPPGFWEVYHGEPFTGALLRVLNEDPDQDRVVARARYKTFLRSWSENRRRAQVRALPMLGDVLDCLTRRGELPAPPDEGLLSLYSRPRHGLPSAMQAAVALGRVLDRSVREKLNRRLFPDRWAILYRHGAAARSRSLDRYNVIEPPPGRFYADPFLVEREGKAWLFVEDMDCRRDLGHIACIELGPEGPRPAVPVIAPGYHLSYPFLFEIGDSLYMIPESASNRTLELWRCRAFPHDWVKQREIFSGIDAVDTTIFQHDDGLWYLFTNIQRSFLSDHAHELHIFVSDDPLEGDWRPHALNPVVTCAESARMGGGFLRLPDGRLARPAQYGAGRYGAGLLLAEVARLSPEAYAERLVERIGPDWRRDAIGIHHICAGETTVVFDVNLPAPPFWLRGWRAVRGGGPDRLRWPGVAGWPSQISGLFARRGATGG